MRDDTTTDARMFLFYRSKFGLTAMNAIKAVPRTAEHSVPNIVYQASYASRAANERWPSKNGGESKEVIQLRYVK